MNETTSTDHFLSNRSYDAAKWATTIFLPAVGTLYFAIAQIWGLPAGEQVLGTLIAVQAFLGVLLGISTRSYNASEAKYDGTLSVSETRDKTIVSVEGKDPAEMLKKDQVLLKVK